MTNCPARSRLAGSTLPAALPAVLAALVALTAPGALCAQTPPPVGTDTSIDVQTYWPSAGPSEHLNLRGSTVSPAWGVGFSLITNFARLPLRTCEPGPAGVSGSCRDLSNPTYHNAVDYAFTTDFGFSLGLFNRLQLMFAVPVVVAQSGDGASPVLGSAGQLSDTALRDLRFDLALAIVQRERSALATGFGLRVDLGFAAPFGDDKAFESSGGWTFIPMLVADYRTSLFTFTVNGGARVRSTSAFANLAVGSQAVVAGGVAFHPAVDSPLNLSAEVFSLVPLVSRDGYTTPSNTEAFVGLRYATDVAHDVELIAGAGFPLDYNPMTPAWRAIAGLSYAPRGNDTDHDGVPDAEDHCPRQAEDIDSFQDDDGCPDPDNDDDHIPDTTDRCPNEPEDVDGYQDTDGCPDPDNDQDGVLDADDQCPNEAQGDHPDPARAGCPTPDRDHDGVLDPQDLCPDTAAGAHPDPARAGCPMPDRDHDGVADTADRCPDTAAGAHPDPHRAGCPDTDVDRDGVDDAHDRCPTQPETINGIEDDDGCPDTGPEHVIWEPSMPDALHFDHPIVVTARAQVLAPAAISLVTQAAQRIRARGAEVSRVLVEVDAAPTPAGTVEAVRQAGLVADVLLAHGVPQREITSDATPGPAPGPAPAGAGVVRRPPVVPGRVHLRIETSATVAPAPMASATPVPPTPSAPSPSAPAHSTPAVSHPAALPAHPTGVPAHPTPAPVRPVPAPTAPRAPVGVHPTAAAQPSAGH